MRDCYLLKHLRSSPVYKTAGFIYIYQLADKKAILKGKISLIVEWFLYSRKGSFFGNEHISSHMNLCKLLHQTKIHYA